MGLMIMTDSEINFTLILLFVALLLSGISFIQTIRRNREQVRQAKIRGIVERAERGM